VESSPGGGGFNYFAALGIEPKALHLRHSTTSTMPPALSIVFCFLSHGVACFAWAGLKLKILLPLSPEQLGLQCAQLQLAFVCVTRVRDKGPGTCRELESC
jgi:hypothetical protein